nr:MAG TPA: hypothetical protein [Bacteriophage sp.]
MSNCGGSVFRFSLLSFFCSLVGVDAVCQFRPD